MYLLQSVNMTPHVEKRKTRVLLLACGLGKEFQKTKIGKLELLPIYFKNFKEK